jgi:hypothetical protein
MILPNELWKIIVEFLDDREKIFVQYNFPNFTNLSLPCKQFIETIIENKSKFMTQIIKSIKPRIVSINMRYFIQDKGFNNALYELVDFFSYRTRDILIKTQTDFLLFIHRKANNKILMFYELPHICNVCYLVLHRNSNKRRSYGKLFEPRDKRDLETFYNRIFYL